MAQVEDPRGKTFEVWARRVLDEFPSAPLPMNAKFWKGWARAIYQTNRDVPNPDRFVNWEDWALAWKSSI
jgi:hypothetical protein